MRYAALVLAVACSNPTEPGAPPDDPDASTPLAGTMADPPPDPLPTEFSRCSCTCHTSAQRFYYGDLAPICAGNAEDVAATFGTTWGTIVRRVCASQSGCACGCSCQPVPQPDGPTPEPCASDAFD